MEWHSTYGVPVGNTPQLLTPMREALRMRLIKEEYEELFDAVVAGDILETADALGDMVYVIYGMAIEMGINLSAVMTEIQRSNMSKLDDLGNPIFREDGKVLKGPNFFDPDLETVLYG
jgi:NTP pyrophosphatase (non-canonical NTP hydrolase)